MPRLVSANCPRCGAALGIDARHELMTCQYCGHRALIEWQGRERQPTAQALQWQGDPNVGRIAVRAPRGALGCILTIVAVTTILPIIIVAVVLVATKKAVQTATADLPHVASDPPPPITQPASATKLIAAADARKVDVAEVVRQARAVAVASEHHADKVSSVVAFNVTGGLLDTTQSNAASVRFSFRYTDPAKAPGQGDVVAGTILVHVHDGQLDPMTLTSTEEKPLADPKCSSKDAWAAAVKSGVPESAVATFNLYDNSPFSPKSPTVWSIRVDGHDEYRREVDAVTCALVKSWADTKKPGR